MHRLSCSIFSLCLLLSVAACDQTASETSDSQALLISGVIDTVGKINGKSGSSLTLRLENLTALPLDKQSALFGQSRHQRIPAR
jgi:hypothetical protein